MTSTSYVTGQRRFRAWLTGYGVQLVKVVDEGMQKRTDDGWEHFAWTLTVQNRYSAYRDATTYDFPFMQGMAHTKKPTLVDLMASLLFDAQTVVNSDGFEDWATELGYDTDSRQAEKIHAQIIANNAKLAKLFRTTDLDDVLCKAVPLMAEAGL